MADQSLRDVSDVERMQASGEVAALNVRPAQIGGLIPSIELVSTVLDKRPNAFVALDSHARRQQDHAGWTDQFGARASKGRRGHGRLVC